MKIIKKIMLSLLALSLVLSNFANAQSAIAGATQTSIQNSAMNTEQKADPFQKATNLISQRLLELKTLGGRLEDEKGREISGEEILTGVITSVAYIPADRKNLKYIFKSNQQTQSVALSVLKMDGTRIAAANFSVDPSITPQENIIKIQQTMNVLDVQVSQSIVEHKLQHKIQSGDRYPAASKRFEMVLLAGAMIGANILVCSLYSKTHKKRYLVNCGFAAIFALLLVV